METRATAEILREMVQHENELRHHRITWLCQVQGFLFAALGFAWGKSSRLTMVFAFLGIALAMLVFMALLGGTRAHLEIDEYWSNHKKSYKGPDVFGLFGVLPDGRRPGKLAYLASENLIPLTFVIGWFLILSAPVLSSGGRSAGVGDSNSTMVIEKNLRANVSTNSKATVP